MFVSYPLLCPLIVATGPVVCFGMAGCLGLVVLVRGILGRLPLGIWLAVSLSAVWVHWAPPDCWDADDVALEMSDHPNIWTEGRTSLLSVGLKWLALVFTCLLLRSAFESAVWGVAEEFGDALLERCRAFVPVPGVSAKLSSVLSSGVPLLPCRLTGLAIWVLINNLNVARAFGRMLDKDCLAEPLPLVKDWDLVALAQTMIRTRGRETVRVNQGHAHDSDVEQGRVRLEDQLGNAEADAAADLGRRHQSELLMDARRILLKVRNHW